MDHRVVGSKVPGGRRRAGRRKTPPAPARAGGGLGSVVADVRVDAAEGAAGEAGEPAAGRSDPSRAGDLELDGVGAESREPLVSDRVAGLSRPILDEGPQVRGRRGATGARGSVVPVISVPG